MHTLPPQATPRFLANPLFLPILPHSILFPLLPSQITLCLKRHTPPFSRLSNTISMATRRTSFQPFFASRCHVVPSFLSSTQAPTPEPLTMLMAVNYITCITTTQKPIHVQSQLSTRFLLSPTRLWVSSPKLTRARPPPHTLLAHFVRPTQLQPSLSAGFRDKI